METLAKTVPIRDGLVDPYSLPDRSERLDPCRTMLICNAVPAKDVWLPLDDATHSSIDLLEEYIAQNFPQVETPLTQTFVDGLYSREAFIPEGTLIVGKMYTEQHLAVLLEGEIMVWTEGDGTRHLTAPCTVISQPGTRRIGYACTDVRWMNVHKNEQNSTDLSDVEKRITATRERAAIGSGDMKKIEAFLQLEMGLDLAPVAYTEVA